MGHRVPAMTAAQKKWVKQKVAKWQKRLLLTDRTFRFNFWDEPSADDTDVDVTQAHVWWQSPTLEHTIDIYPALWDESVEQAEQCLLHELVHIWVRGGEEDVVAHITSTLWRLCEGRALKRARD